VDLDDYKRPRSVPQLAGWATPAGWRQGLRPRYACEQGQSKGTPAGNGGNSQQNGNGAAGDRKTVREIERMEGVAGKRRYRGILKSVARAWNPRDIQEGAVQEKALAHLLAAQKRIAASRDSTGEGGFDSFRPSSRIFAVELP
jgi:hypothetical protein